MKLVVLAAVLGAVGVAIGAYAAHGLEKSLLEQALSPEDVAKRLGQCDVAVRYHMVHVLALLAIGLGRLQFGALLRLASGLLLLGIVLFSGGLYSMALAGVMGHWAIVPAGGLCFMLGWLALAVAAAVGKTSNAIATEG